MNKQFITMSGARCTFDNYVAAPYIRKSFTLDFVPEMAEISVCGLGFYRLFINGSEITKGQLAPYINNPDHFCYFDRYDLSGRLAEGENVVGIVLGNGFYNPFGAAEWGFEKAPWVGTPCVALELTAEGGSKSLHLTADESFRVHPSPIIFDELRMGEYYDANAEIDGWCMPGFDDSGWENAIFAPIPRGEMRECIAEPIIAKREIAAKSITKTDGGYLYDFGENTAGVCRLRISARKNQKIELRHCEILKDGKFSDENIIFDHDYYRTHNQKDIYIAKGVGCEEYTPGFTYHGFRYVQVAGIDETQATAELLTCVVMHSDIAEIGGFECSDEVANTLFDMVKRSDLSNFYYFPTDCPHREKHGWTGDAAASAEHMALMYDVEKSWREWLANIRMSQNSRGELPGIVPTAGWGYEWGNGPAWDRVLFDLPYELFKKRANTDVIRENAHAMLRYLQYITGRRSSDGTVAFGLGDWVPVGRRPDAYTAPLALTDSIMVMDMARKATEMFAAAELSHEADYARAVAEDMRCAIRRNLVDFDSMTAAGECQSSQAMALFYGVFDADEERRAFEVLLSLIHENGDSFDCGYLGLRVIFHVLARFGETELAYKMITKKDYPSYGHLLELGETTLTEQFMPDGVSCGSHNHHFLGDIANWFMSELAGLKIIDSAHVRIEPAFIGGIDRASAYYELPQGRVSVSWERADSEIVLRIDAPQGCDVTIPAWVTKSARIKF